jgi:hypothetical protein
MVKRFDDKMLPTAVVERPHAVVTKSTVEGIDTDILSRRLQHLYVGWLTTRLETALVLARRMRHQRDPESRLRTKKRASATCRFIREQRLKVPLDTQNSRWVDEKLEEIERFLEIEPTDKNPA